MAPSAALRRPFTALRRLRRTHNGGPCSLPAVALGSDGGPPPSQPRFSTLTAVPFALGRGSRLVRQATMDATHPPPVFRLTAANDRAKAVIGHYVKGGAGRDLFEFNLHWQEDVLVDQSQLRASGARLPRQPPPGPHRRRGRDRRAIAADQDAHPPTSWSTRLASRCWSTLGPATASGTCWGSTEARRAGWRTGTTTPRPRRVTISPRWTGSASGWTIPRLNKHCSWSSRCGFR